MLPYRDSRVIRIILVLFFVLAGAYALYEAQGILFGPMIHLPEKTITVHDEFTTVRGRAERITELRLNGTSINVTENGAFEEQYLAAPGLNHLIFEARDARGRVVQQTLDIIYMPPPAAPPPAPPASSSTSTEDISN